LSTVFISKSDLECQDFINDNTYQNGQNYLSKNQFRRVELFEAIIAEEKFNFILKEFIYDKFKDESSYEFKSLLLKTFLFS